MSGIGHNNGPTLEPGFGWRRHSWARARADLIPNLPVEILRRRVSRAKDLGLPYKTYASVRASTGRDVIGFLFSNNALRVLRAHDAVPVERVEQLRKLQHADLLGLVHPPVSPTDLSGRCKEADIALLSVNTAPVFDAPWSAIRQRVCAPIADAGLPRDGILVIGDTSHERLWSEAGKLAGFLHSDRYFEGAAG